MFVFLAVGCENTNSETEVNDSSLTYSVASFAGHDAVIVKPSDLDVTSTLVVIVTDDLELKTRLSPTPAINEVNFKAAEHCLIGRYTLCVIEAEETEDVSYLNDIKSAFPNASKLYLVSYRNGVAYTAAMQIPATFAAYACVSGAIDVESYKVCLLYTSPSPRDRSVSRMPSSA